MDDKTRARLGLVGDIVERELGERWGDGYIVTDVIVGYAEPGYGSLSLEGDEIVVLGDWNQKRWVRDGEPPLTDEESFPGRLADMLGEIDGVGRFDCHFSAYVRGLEADDDNEED